MGPTVTPQTGPDMNLVFSRNKAAKNDDASVNVDYWDLEVASLWKSDSHYQARLQLFLGAYGGAAPMGSIRKLALRVWRRYVWKSLRRHLCRMYDINWEDRRSDFISSDLETTLTATRDCISRCMHAEWWEWTQGSCLMFWHWPHESQKWARDGLQSI
jgi:hypothetical protein